MIFLHYVMEYYCFEKGMEKIEVLRRRWGEDKVEFY